MFKFQVFTLYMKLIKCSLWGLMDSKYFKMFLIYFMFNFILNMLIFLRFTT